MPVNTFTQVSGSWALCVILRKASRGCPRLAIIAWAQMGSVGVFEILAATLRSCAEERGSRSQGELEDCVEAALWSLRAITKLLYLTGLASEPEGLLRIAQQRAAAAGLVELVLGEVAREPSIEEGEVRLSGVALVTLEGLIRGNAETSAAAAGAHTHTTCTAASALSSARRLGCGTRASVAVMTFGCNH